MSRRIAIIGGGINGLMIAQACAGRGGHVDVYDAGAIPNPQSLSYGKGRLWRHIHPENHYLQDLSLRSLPYWKTLIRDEGPLMGALTPTIRVVSDADAQQLSERYRQAGESFSLESYWLSPQRSLFELRYKSDVIFHGHDGLLLNARRVCDHLVHGLAGAPSVRFISGAHVDTENDLSGTSVRSGNRVEHYDRVVLATGAPAANTRAEIHKRYQVHLDVVPADSRAAALYPVLDMGDDETSWSIPSPDRQTVKISASAFAFSAEPDAALREACWRYLAARVKFGYVRAEKCLSEYHEMPAAERKNTPYWRRDGGTGLYLIDACDAGLFKAAPALSEAVAADIFEKESK